MKKQKTKQNKTNKQTKKQTIQAFEAKCQRKLLRISYLEHKTNNSVRGEINFPVGPQWPPLETGERRQIARFGRVTRSDSVSKAIVQGTLKNGRRRGQQKNCWMENIKEKTTLPIAELLSMVFC